MATRCAECTRLWNQYYLAATEEFRSQELHEAAQRTKGTPELIADLSDRAHAAARSAAAASDEMRSHHALHSGPPALRSN